MTRTDELRALLANASLSQREAAEAIEVHQRSMRRWCAANPPPPLMALYALRYLYGGEPPHLSASRSSQ